MAMEENLCASFPVLSAIKFVPFMLSMDSSQFYVSFIYSWIFLILFLASTKGGIVRGYKMVSAEQQSAPCVDMATTL